MLAFFRLLKSALDAYIYYSFWKQRTYLHKIEDEIDRLAADGGPAAKLRLERLSRRLRSERERIVRPPDDNAG